MTISEIPSELRGASWGADDTIIFGRQGPGGLWRVSGAGGEPQEISTPGDDGGRHRWPDILPGGAGVVFMVDRGPGLGNEDIAILDMDTGEHRVIIPGGLHPRYSPTGHIIYGVEGTLRAVTFDLDTLEVTSDPVPVVEGVQVNNVAAVSFDLSETGSLVYVSGAVAGGAVRSFVWVDRDGREEPLPLPPRMYSNPRLSPDGTRLAVAVSDQGPQALWVYDVISAAGLRLTQEARAMAPLWTPDGERVVFTYNPEGTNDLAWVPPDGSGEVELLTTSPDVGDVSTSVTPDGRAALFIRIDGAQREIWEVPLDGERTPTPVLQGEFQRGNADVSPDGKWMAYRSDQSGQMEIYLQPYPGPGPTVPVSIGGGDMAT